MCRHAAAHSLIPAFFIRILFSQQPVGPEYKTIIVLFKRPFKNRQKHYGLGLNTLYVCPQGSIKYRLNFL